MLPTLDWQIASWAHTHQSPAMTTFMTYVSMATSSRSCNIGAALVSCWLLQRRRFTSAAILFFGTASAGLAGEILKIIFKRDRPPFSTVTNSYSFPSGHTLSSTVFFGLFAWLLSYDLPRQRLWLISSAAGIVTLVGCSRIYLGAHWPTDVLGGAAIGFVLVRGWRRLALMIAAHNVGRRKYNM